MGDYFLLPLFLFYFFIIYFFLNVIKKVLKVQEKMPEQFGIIFLFLNNAKKKVGMNYCLVLQSRKCGNKNIIE